MNPVSGSSNWADASLMICVPDGGAARAGEMTQSKKARRKENARRPHWFPIPLVVVLVLVVVIEPATTEDDDDPYPLSCVPVRVECGSDFHVATGESLE